MKKIELLLIAFMFMLSACHQHRGWNVSGYSFPDVIPVDTGNKMLSSYLASINYTGEDTDIQSMFFDARIIRYYLDSVPGGDSITRFKLMFAHTLSYINSGHVNQPAGYKTGALTIIIAGYKDNGDIVYLPNRLVIDNASLCPTNCPTGAAGQSLLPN